MTRFVLLDQLTGRTIYLSLSDVKTMHDVLHRATCNYRPEPLPAVPDLRPSGSGDQGHDILHKFWSSIGGADPIPGDLNHYSLEYRGMRLILK